MMPQRAAAQVLLLTTLALVLVVGGGWWGWRQFKSRPTAIAAPVSPVVVLSDSTMRILGGLEASVELRWFVPADAGVLPLALEEYVTRVGSLLAEYENLSSGKLRVNKTDARAHPTAKAAAGAAGIAPFTTECGEIVYLGLIVASGARQEVIFPLSPEWEAALESDVSRAIARVTTKVAPAISAVPQVAGAPPPIDPALSEELLRTFPNLAALSFEDAAKVLRERALEEFKTVAAEAQAKVNEAQKNFAETQANKGAAEVQSAQKEFQRAQAEQTRQLSEITARLAERIAVLQQLKGTPNLPVSPR